MQGILEYSRNSREGRTDLSTDWQGKEITGYSIQQVSKQK